MLDIRFVREHPDEVKENIKKKFQDAKLPLVDEVINLDAEYRAAIGEGDGVGEAPVVARRQRGRGHGALQRSRRTRMGRHREQKRP